MALNASGAISLGGSTAGQSIALELGLSATGQISLNDAAVRTLAGVPSGAIVMPTNFWGKANQPTGSLWAWGRNDYGQLGQGNTTSLSSPVQVGAVTTWTKARTGADNVLALTTGKTMWFMGRNLYGCAGQNDGTTSQYTTLTQIGALTTWVDIANTTGATCYAVKDNGTLWSWGQNYYGSLGYAGGNKSSPAQVGALTNWKYVTGCNSQGVAVKTDGTLWGWGQNAFAIFGPAGTPEFDSPRQIGSDTNWKYAISTALGISMIKTNGTLWGIGPSYSGELGNNKQFLADGFFGASSPVQVGALTTWDILATSSDTENSGAIRTDKTLWSWGAGGSGRNGDGTTTSRSSPVQVGADTNWVSRGIGTQGAGFAVKTNGTIYSWGNNNNAWGQLGLGNNNATYTTPQQIGAATNWASMVCGGTWMAVAIRS